MLRVLIADKLPDAARTRLQEAGCEVFADPSLKGEPLTEALAEHEPDVLIVRSTKVLPPQLDATRNLQLIVRAGAGVNTIDLAGASGRGIYVSNCPGMNAVAVAELTFAHILNADRRLADCVADLRAGQWRKKVYAKRARGLKGRTLGVIGVGSIGQEVIRRALAFEMQVVAWSRSLTGDEAAALGVTRCESAVDVARRADVVTVHLASTPATRHFVGPSLFDAMRPGTIFVNTSRGEVVDEEALAEAARDKGVLAGLDVYQGEPNGDGDWSTPLAALDGVYGTHHIGASTAQAQQAVADEACRVVLEWRATGEAPNCVNLARQTPATHLLVVRHADKIGVLASVLDCVRRDGINIQQMENVIFDGARAALARIQLESEPSEGLIDSLRALDTLFDAKLIPLEDSE